MHLKIFIAVLKLNFFITLADIVYKVVGDNIITDEKLQKDPSYLVTLF